MGYKGYMWCMGYKRKYYLLHPFYPFHLLFLVSCSAWRIATISSFPVSGCSGPISTGGRSLSCRITTGV